MIHLKKQITEGAKDPKAELSDKQPSYAKVLVYLWMISLTQ